MKRMTLFAVALAAAICALPLAGCGGKFAGKPFDINNYAAEPTGSISVSSRFRETPMFATMQTIRMRLRSLAGNPEMAVEYGADEDKCRLYSLKQEEPVSDWYRSIALYGSSPYLILTCLNDSSDDVYQIAWPTGEPLFEETFPVTPSFVIGGGYYDTESSESVRWYGLTYYPDDGGEAQKFYTAYADGAWKKLTEEEIFGEDDGYQVGDNLGIVKTSLANPETYPDYIYKDYGYVREGNSSAYKYTFYKGDDKLDSVTVFNDAVCGVVGHYFYYYDETPVSADAEKGYNVEVIDGSGLSQKLNAVLRRYDFVGGKDEKVDTNYFFTPSGTLYNKAANDFDRILVRAYKKENNVAIVSQAAQQYTLILDDEARVSLDMTAKNLSLPFYRLSDERFLTGRTIVDKDFNTVAQLPGSNVAVWKEQSLIVTNGYNGYIAVDYDGKVALTGMSNISGVSGNHLIAYNREDALAAFSKASPEGKTLPEITGDKNPYYMNGLLYVQTENGLVFYNMDGKKLGEYEGVLNSADPLVYDGSYFFSATNGTESVTLLFR